jgi:alkylation response protein AidB-like acyl-CoA dehydrogenase
LYDAMLAERAIEPVLTPWDAWGHRVDAIEVSPLWKRAEEICVEKGLVSAAYDSKLGDKARIHQFAMNYIVQASMDVYSCPLAMTDGAARTLLETGNQALIDHALPHLLSKDPATFWTSGQWMTERTGGSDVGASETVAKKEGGAWSLHGTKWFTSATTSQMALTLGRPEGNGQGGRGLALFFVELRDADGKLCNIEVNRLKDKLGTRKVPTAELTLKGTPATLVSDTENGIRNITPMLGITRTWNAVASAWGMRRAVALARDYSSKRSAFGSPLADKPLHRDTLASIAAEAEAAFLLAFRCAELLGKIEAESADEQERQLFRVLTPVTKLTTAKQAVAVASEALECFGGAGYVEDTGLPRLLADAQVLPIWEGTTNVLSLDTLRAISKDADAMAAYVHEVTRCCDSVRAPGLAAPVKVARAALESAREWLMKAMNNNEELEAGARRFAMTLGRCLELALLCEHAQWVGENPGGKSPDRAAAAARRFATQGIDLILEVPSSDAALLARGE